LALASGFAGQSTAESIKTRIDFPFTVVGNTYALSEVWIPGVDGYVLQVTRGKHTHKVVNVQR
jgi:hypothetical protein